ncbi:hypothetical protein GpartN1_g1952.t1 [Galdieria partita]|uniref:Uncharacterized protein n=1 Tax=Galdieria partita TaxID=83374 RepID=A0A9C7PTI1_9RHOD|nr:hypothetical protein GpartN1_g1952.t1 [Galdieria partita]
MIPFADLWKIDLAQVQQISSKPSFSQLLYLIGASIVSFLNSIHLPAVQLVSVHCWFSIGSIEMKTKFGSSVWKKLPAKEEDRLRVSLSLGEDGNHLQAILRKLRIEWGCLNFPLLMGTIHLRSSDRFFSVFEYVGSRQMISTRFSMMIVFQIVMAQILLEKQGILLSSLFPDDVLIKKFPAAVEIAYFDNWTICSDDVAIITTGRYTEQKDDAPHLVESVARFLSSLDVTVHGKPSLKEELNQMIQFIFGDASLSVLALRSHHHFPSTISSVSLIENTLAYGAMKKWLMKGNQKLPQHNLSQFTTRPGIGYNLCSFCYLFSTDNPFMKTSEAKKLLEEIIDKLKNDLSSKENPSKTSVEIQAVQEMADPSTAVSLEFLAQKAQDLSQ